MLPGSDSVLDAFAEQLESELARLIDAASSGARQWAEAMSFVRALVQAGGKRVRPRLLAASFLATGGRELTPPMVAFGAGIELIHTCMLIHDDVMDGSALRRGVPAVHCALQQELIPEQRCAENVAIVMGDLLAMMAAHQFMAEGLDLQRARRAARAVHQAMRASAEGQVMDVICDALPLDAAQEDDILRTCRLKTACFAFEAPLRAGVILAGGNSGTEEAMARFGLWLGTAYQLRDDFIGFLGQESAIGKRAADDWRAGKKTLLLLRLWQRCNATERERIAGLLQQREPTAEQLDWLRQTARQRGVLQELEERIEALSRQALQAIDSVELVDRWRDYLALLVRWLAQRTY